MANRTVVVDLIVNTAKWTAGFQKASHDMASATTNAETKTRALQQQVGLLGIGMTAFSALAVKKWADFDQAMSRVEATGGSAAESIGKLTAAAQSDDVTQLGYSATEAAESIYELTKAGVEADYIIGGALAGSLSLAAAETLDAAEAASIMASALTQFGLEGEHSAHVADLLVAAAGKAQGSAHDLGFALKQSGLVANQFGLSIEETTGSLALFANAGLIGSDAGTSLRTMLLHLVGPSGKAADLMKEIGLEVYGANGQFVGMEQFADNLQSSLSVLSEKQRNQALATIFGADATRAASLLYREGGDAVAEWTAKVNDAGYAQEVARKRMDNLNGDLKILSATWEQFLIGMGSSADAPLRSLIQGVTAVVEAFSELPPAVQGVVMALAGGGGLGILGVLALGQVMSALTSLQVGLVNTGKVSEVTATRITNGMKIATIATGALGAAATIGFAMWASAAAEAEAAVDGYIATLNDAAETTNATVNHISEILTEGQDLGWNDFFGNYDLISNAEKMGVAVEDLAGYILGEADAVDRVNAAWENYQGDAFSFGSNARSNDIQRMTTALDDQKNTLAEAKKEKELQNAVNEKLAGTEADAAEGMDDLGNSAGEAASAIEEQTKAIQENIDAWHELAGIHMDEDEAMANYQQAVDDANEAIKTAQTDTEKYSELLGENRKRLDLNTQAGRDAQDALQGMADAALKQMQASYDAGASTAELTKQMRGARTQFVQAAVDAGLTREAARALADSYGLIPDNVSTTVDAVDHASGTIKSIKQQLAELRDQTVYITTVRRNATERAQRGAPGNSDSGFATGGFTGMGQKYETAGLVHKGEWVIRQESTNSLEREFPGLLGALNNRGAAALVGGFAGGGAVGQAENALQRAQRRSRDAHQELREAQAAEKRARTESAKRAAERRVQFAERILEGRQEAVNEAREKLARLREQAANLRTDLRRGNISDQVTGGLSGAQSVTDQLRDLAASGDVSKFGSRRLNRVANEAERALTRLYDRAEKIDRKIERATTRFEKWKAIADNVSASISDGFSLGEVSGGTDPWTGKEKQASGQQILAASLSYQAKARNLVLKLRALQDAGYGTAILQEVAMQGVDGGVAMADALLQLSPADMKALQESQRAIDFYADRAGIAATDDKVTSAARALEQAEAQGRMIDQNILKWSKVLGSELARALGLTPRAGGGDIQAGSAYKVGEVGTELFIPQTSGYMLSNQQMNSLTAGPQRIVNVNVTQNYPQTIPFSKGINKALQHAAEEVLS